MSSSFATRSTSSKRRVVTPKPRRLPQLPHGTLTPRTNLRSPLALLRPPQIMAERRAEQSDNGFFITGGEGEQAAPGEKSEEVRHSQAALS